VKSGKILIPARPSGSTGHGSEVPAEKRMKMKVLIAYDGSLHAKAALKYAIRKIKEQGGALIALHVFESLKFIDYEAGPDAEQKARTESLSHIQDAKRIIEEVGSGIPIKLVWAEGIPGEEIVNYAADEDVDIVFSPPRFSSIAKKIFCPVYIISGNKVIAYDNAGGPITFWSSPRSAELNSVR
jgi:hypothetical protein